MSFISHFIIVKTVYNDIVYNDLSVITARLYGPVRIPSKLFSKQTAYNNIGYSDISLTTTKLYQYSSAITTNRSFAQNKTIQTILNLIDKH